jgi:predicted AlkP superfamily pyrophosphatase or phosphodiesterase
VAGVVRLGRAFSQALITRDLEKRTILLRHAKLDLSADLFRFLTRRYQTGFSAFATFLVDLISHRYWRYREPDVFDEPLSPSSDQFRTAVTDAYKHVDRVIGRLLSAAPPETVVAVVSEHGMAAEPESGEVGRWRYVIRGDSLHKLLGLNENVQVCPVARWIAFRFTADPSLQERVAARMRRVIVEQTGLPLFQVHLHAHDEVIVKFNLHRDNEVYRRGDLESLTIRYNDSVVPFAALSKRLGRQRSGMHDGDGVLIMRGPKITAGGSFRNAQLVDFMPTLLHASGLQVPAHIDGAVLSIFKTTS